jgi:prevent-host-death family protein
MRKASVSDLKASVSEYLARVKAGEEVLVTDRGKPIAKIIPLRRNESEAGLKMAQLEVAGLARVGKGRSARRLLACRPTCRQDGSGIYRVDF